MIAHHTGPSLLHGTVTALVETNVNWQNFTFRDKWESLLQRCYASLQFPYLNLLLKFGSPDML